MLATSSAPLTISGYIWFDISGTNIPTVLVLCVFKLLATILGLYPSFFIASKTFFLVSSFTTSMSFNTLETVAIDTPASLATSLIEAAI